jgi:hypothetical protein
MRSDNGEGGSGLEVDISMSVCVFFFSIKKKLRVDYIRGMFGTIHFRAFRVYVTHLKIWKG